MSIAESASVKIPPGPEAPAARRASELRGDRLHLGGVVADDEPREGVHRRLERRRQRGAEEREAETDQALVRPELEGDELARVGGGGEADDQRVVGRGAQHAGGDVSDLHRASPPGAMVA